jgi:hypothetical protein
MAGRTRSRPDGWEKGGAMLTRVRIEVEEDTAEACVEALWKYELALQQQEVRRYRDLWPVTLTDEPERKASRGEALPEIANATEAEYPTPDEPWSVSVEDRTGYDELLGREIHEEVIEYDATLPGYRGRRVVAYDRVDTRKEYALIEPSWTMANLISSASANSGNATGSNA